MLSNALFVGDLLLVQNNFSLYYLPSDYVPQIDESSQQETIASIPPEIIAKRREEAVKAKERKAKLIRVEIQYGNTSFCVRESPKPRYEV